MGKIKSFRGILGDNEQQRIHLAGGDSDTGYKIHKLQGITKEPFQTDGEHVIKVYKVKQSSVTDTVDLSDETLLGVVTFNDAATSSSNYTPQTIIVDNEVVNQDIYITHIDARSTQVGNFYLELEEVKMTNGEQAVVNFRAALLHGE